MITREQTDALAKELHMDRFTIMREYLQLVFLSSLYQDRLATHIYFKGGTAIRLLLGSSRFSEDLDFSTTLTKAQIAPMIKRLKHALQKELPGLTIHPLYSGRTGIRYRLKYQPRDFKYPLTIRLDVAFVKKVAQATVSPLVTKFPIVLFPIVSHLSGAEILAEKICALMTRSKGRDLFDVWYLLEKGIPLDKKILQEKLPAGGTTFNQASVLKKVATYPPKRLRLDLAQFLPGPQKAIIDMLPQKLAEKIAAGFEIKL